MQPALALTTPIMSSLFSRLIHLFTSRPYFLLKNATGARNKHSENSPQIPHTLSKWFSSPIQRIPVWRDAELLACPGRRHVSGRLWEYLSIKCYQSYMCKVKVTVTRLSPAKYRVSMLHKRTVIIVNNTWLPVFNIFKFHKHKSFCYTFKWPPSPMCLRSMNRFMCNRVRIMSRHLLAISGMSHLPPPDGVQTARF
jgi:hypothetical protein